MLQPCHQHVYKIAELLAIRPSFAPSLFFNLDKDPTYMRTTRVIASYVAVLPPEDAILEPNRWMVVLKTGKQTTIKIELKQADPLGNTLICCSNGPRVLKSGELENCARSWAVEVRKGSTVSEWLDRVVETGLTRYRLVRGLGESFKYYVRAKANTFYRVPMVDGLCPTRAEQLFLCAASRNKRYESLASIGLG
jgi:hypothetical protein